MKSWGISLQAWSSKIDYYEQLRFVANGTVVDSWEGLCTPVENLNFEAFPRPCFGKQPRRASVVDHVALTGAFLLVSVREELLPGRNAAQCRHSGKDPQCMSQQAETPPISRAKHDAEIRTIFLVDSACVLLGCGCRGMYKRSMEQSCHTLPAHNLRSSPALRTVSSRKQCTPVLLISVGLDRK